MIDKIILKAGPNGPSEQLEFNTAPINIFVGPNNSGKSLLLREIENSCNNGRSIESNKILKNIELHKFQKDEISNLIENIKLEPLRNENILDGYIVIGKISPQRNGFIRTVIEKKSTIEYGVKGNYTNMYMQPIIQMFTLRLDGTNRLSLLGLQGAGDLKSSPQNHLSLLFQNNELREKVRDIIYDAFQKYFIVDPTNIGNLSIRLSDRKPIDEEEEKGWTSKSISFHKAAKSIDQYSDGVKAYIGILLSVLTTDPKVLLIDEPEAFLHPSLSYKLAKDLCNSVANTDKKIFISTHSADFIMGCIQSGIPVNIVRLTYNNESATSRLLSNEELLELMKHPLLRSAGVLNGLFYENVIVTEGDSDRAFYQEINYRLLSANDDRGIRNCLFLNAQNKQTIWQIVEPLRKLGIPAASIYDLDVLCEGGNNWTNVLKGHFIPESSHSGLQNQRKTLKTKFDESGKELKKDGTLILGKTDLESFGLINDNLIKYGLFIVQYGELECWLKHLEITGHSPQWLIQIFEKMGSDSNDPNYLKPYSGDVWDFIGSINSWFKTSNKRGIP
jgi:AAA15 family ATPase/GTPase